MVHRSGGVIVDTNMEREARRAPSAPPGRSRFGILEKYRYEDLSWPEVNEAVVAGRIPPLPVGAIEQHGLHLPLKIDSWESTSIADEAAGRSPDRLLVMAPVAYGHATHVMDFPGTITVHQETFIRFVVNILKSLAYHGFKRTIVQRSRLEPARLNWRPGAVLETDAWVAMASWWNLTQADPEFMATWS
jgi:creatinine amidohydrolase